MAHYEADPTFDAFNAILPYSKCAPSGDDFDPWFENFLDFPVTATTRPPSSAAKAPALPDKLGSSQALQADPTASLAAIRHQILQIPGIIPEYKLDGEYASKALQKLRTVMDNCRTVLQIDVDRIARRAIATRNLQILKYLAEECGASLLSRDMLGRTPVMYAAAHDLGSEHMTLKYIAGKLTDEKVFRTELNHQDLDGKTALHYAVQRNNPSVAQFCAEHGADPAILDKTGGSVWDLGQAGDHDACLLMCTLYASIPSSLDLPLYISEFDKFVNRATPKIMPKIMPFKTFVGSTDPVPVDILAWVHIPWTNGPLIYAVLKNIISQHTLEKHGQEISLADLLQDQEAILEGFLKSFSNSPTVPGDPHLTYRVPSCYGSMELDANLDPTLISVVFPCLVIQDMSNFEKSRAELRDLRNAVGWSNIGKYFQMARTLDETYYPSLTRKVLNTRNMHQVVTRECKETINGANISDATRAILMVPQFWIWGLKDLVISSYSPPGKLPSRPKDYAPDESVPNERKRREWIEKNIGTLPNLAELKIGSPVAHIAALLIDQIRRFGRIQAIGPYQSPLDIFELGVVRVLSTVDDYMKDDSLAGDAIVKEKDLVNDIADIRDELAMMDDVLRQQDAVLDSFMKQGGQFLGQQDAELDSLKKQEGQLLGLQDAELDNHFRKQSDLTLSRDDTAIALTNLQAARDEIKGYRERVSKIDKDAERVDKTVQDRLNLKRTFASIRDARASIRDAKTSLLLAIAVIGFTVITILFAPLAFMTALFALNIDELVKHKKGTGDDAVYPSWYIFVTFGASEIITILLTVLLVWICLRNKDALTAWAEQLSHGSEDMSRSEMELEKEPTTTTQISTKTPKTNTATAATTTTPATKAAGVQRKPMDAVDGEKDARSSRSSVLSQRRPHAADPTDAEERGEIRATN
ncbi:hypothetical protein NA57DRAFT_79248 [Rhizodiscina lignyota]|uniref:Ankyrin repeat protein n=1 Tax=Rhizodiscina lignyota TaxID=1504668 RepID=A0A9P4I9B3_9PEZI|nr:hypothetical protein NA57DRAFT_79248 [Rhizodiscina lignyota]